jgi:hypothetical protein
MRALQQQAEQHCSGRMVAVHEGGYSELYVPFCGLAVIEQMSGIKTKVCHAYVSQCSCVVLFCNWGRTPAVLLWCLKQIMEQHSMMRLQHT